jgi:hypothetical protein
MPIERTFNVSSWLKGESANAIAYPFSPPFFGREPQIVPVCNSASTAVTRGSTDCRVLTRINPRKTADPEMLRPRASLHSCESRASCSRVSVDKSTMLLWSAGFSVCVFVRVIAGRYIYQMQAGCKPGKNRQH